MTSTYEKEGLDTSVNRLVHGAWTKQPAWFFNRLPCHGLTDLFYPDRHSGEVMQAKIICGTCVFREDCLEWALANNEKHGVWGGTSERERRKLKRARRVAAAAVAAQQASKPVLQIEPRVRVIKVKRRFTKKKKMRRAS